MSFPCHEICFCEASEWQNHCKCIHTNIYKIWNKEVLKKKELKL